MGRHPGTYHQMKVLGFDPPILWGCFGTVRKLSRSGVMGYLGRTLPEWNQALDQMTAAAAVRPTWPLRLRRSVSLDTNRSFDSNLFPTMCGSSNRFANRFRSLWRSAVAP